VTTGDENHVEFRYAQPNLRALEIRSVERYRSRICVITVVFLSLIFSVAAIGVENKKNVQTEKTAREKTLDEVARPWWLGDLVTVIGILVGASMILYQLGRQHKNELKIQKENYREQRRLQIYQEFSKVLEEANDKTSDAGMYAFLISTNFKIYFDQVNSGFNSTPLRARAIEFSNKHYDGSYSIIKLIRLFEKYEIISPELDIFKLAVNVATHDMRETFHPLYSFLLQILPMEIVDNAGNKHLVNVISPTQEQITQLDAHVNTYKSAQDDLGGYLFDLNVELQNIFLRRLFDNKVKRRKPIDPNVKVVTTDSDDMEKLEKYFKEETAWGKHVKKSEDDVRNIFNQSL